MHDTLRANILSMISFFLSMASMSVHAESTLDKYLKKNTETKVAANSQTEVAGVNKVFKSTDGYWRLDDTRSVGGSCSITYVAGTYYAGYVGPSAGSADAYIVFSGPAIPPVKKVARKKMTMTAASDDQFSSVFAFHGPNGQKSDRGIISIRMTSIEEAIDLMSDTEEIGITMDDKKAFSIKWRGGHTARKAMQKCLNMSEQKAGAK